MKQHMLTHKIRDMPQHMFEKPQMKSEDSSPQQQQPLPAQPREFKPAEPEKTNLLPQPEPPSEPPAPKREPTEIDMPLPKRPPSKYRTKDDLHHLLLSWSFLLVVTYVNITVRFACTN